MLQSNGNKVAGTKTKVHHNQCQQATSFPTWLLSETHDIKFPSKSGLTASLGGNKDGDSLLAKLEKEEGKRRHAGAICEAVSQNQPASDTTSQVTPEESPFPWEAA